jgi:hypothetical protein
MFGGNMFFKTTLRIAAVLSVFILLSINPQSTAELSAYFLSAILIFVWAYFEFIWLKKNKKS